MWTTRYAILAIATAIAALAEAQTVTNVGGYGYENPYSWHASTAAEGYARGFAEIVRAAGEYNLNTGIGAVNWAEARRREILNSKLWVQTWFDIREINQAHRYATYRQQRGNPENYYRIVEGRRPQSLAAQDINFASGQLRWPLLLAFDDYRPQRTRVENAFTNRAYNGAMSIDDYLNVLNATQIMLARLQNTIAAVPPQEYVAAKRFLERVAFDARSTVSSVAARPAPAAGSEGRTVVR